MSAIAVENLTKIYPNGALAVDGISFRVEKGEIVGFLGLNGAGKSTTMKILTCFMPATSGRAEVAGHDIFTDSLNVRRNIGYLPENVPLYPDMRVIEYLKFRAALKGVPWGRRAGRIRDAVERCGVEPVISRIVGQISKGFRQRVGLADALVHDPPILILDEPTVGLDPSQIREVRGLIKEIGKERTVLLSTHILPEVEMVCDRAVIIHRGRIAVDGKLADLRGLPRLRVEARGRPAEIEEALRGISGVRGVSPGKVNGTATFYLDAPGDAAFREKVAAEIARRGIPLVTLVAEEARFEEVFLQAVRE